MQETNLLLNFYKSSYLGKFKKFAEPLEKHFGIDTFAYSSITPKGAFFQISNQPQLSEFYFDNKLYKTNSLIRHPDNYYSSAFFPSAVNDENMRSDQIKLPTLEPEKFLAIYKKQEKNVHLFLFATKKNNIPISSIYINNLTILDRFCDHFLIEWEQYLKKMEPYTIDMGKLLGPIFFEKKGLHFGTELKRKKEFLKSIRLINEGDNFNQFTEREKDCMRALVEGKTLKEIGKALHISPRTVENHYENVKSKLYCATKSEVIQKIQILKLIDL